MVSDQLETHTQDLDNLTISALNFAEEASNSNSPSLAELPQADLPEGYKFHIYGNTRLVTENNYGHESGDLSFVVSKIDDPNTLCTKLSAKAINIEPRNNENEAPITLVQFRDLSSRERGKGLGTSIIRNLQSFAVQIGAKAVFANMGTLDADAQKRGNFYIKNGFTILSENTANIPGEVCIVWKNNSDLEQ